MQHLGREQSVETFRATLAATLAWCGDYAAAAAESAALIPLCSQKGTECYALGGVYSLAAASVRRDARLTPQERDSKAETYATQAIETLRLARAAGYFQNRRNLEHLKDALVWGAIRDRDGFAQLLSPSGQE
jgi:hypothetical protein